MTDDPVVREVHKARETLYHLSDGDMEIYLDRLEKSQELNRERLVTTSDLTKPISGQPSS